VESTIGGHRGPQAPYGGQDYGYPAYPVYPEGATSGGYSTPAPGYAGQGGPAYPDYGSGGPAPGDGWWGPGATGGRPFGDPAAQADSRASGMPPPGPEPAPAAAPRQSATTAGPAVLGTRPAATEAGRPPAAKDGDGAFRPTARPEPGVGGN
jgi:hypothetical protein